MGEVAQRLPVTNNHHLIGLDHLVKEHPHWLDIMLCTALTSTIKEELQIRRYREMTHRHL